MVDSFFNVGDWSISEHEVFAGEQLVDLTATHKRILWFLARRPGRVVAYPVMESFLFSGNTADARKLLSVHMWRLRMLLKKNKAPFRIVAVRECGYMMETKDG